MLQYLDSQFADVFVVVVIVAPRRPTAATAATAATADDATPSFGGGGGDDDGGGGEHLADLGTTRRRRATTTHERRNDAIFVDTIVFISLFVSNYYSFVHRLRRSKYNRKNDVSVLAICHFLARSPPPVTALSLSTFVQPVHIDSGRNYPAAGNATKGNTCCSRQCNKY